MYTNIAILAMTQNHPYGLLMTQHFIDQVNDRAYYDAHFYDHGNSDISNLNITGPDAVRWEFIKDHAMTWYNARCYQEKDEKTNQWYTYLANTEKGNNRTILSISDPVKGSNTYDKMKHCPNCNNYTDLFYNRQVYCDQPGPDCELGNYTVYRDENTWKHMKSINEDGVVISNTPGKRYFNQSAVREESRLLFDVDRAHNISTGEFTRLRE